MWIAGNHKPAINNVDEAIHRRLNLVPFTVTIPENERDKDLTDKLKEEAPAILRRIIDGCIEWQRIGLKPPAVVREATDQYLAEEDFFALWLADHTIADDDGYTTTADLFADFTKAAGAAGESPGKMRKFAGVLRDRGFKSRRQGGTGKAGFEGLRLVNLFGTTD